MISELTERLESSAQRNNGNLPTPILFYYPGLNN